MLPTRPPRKAPNNQKTNTKSKLSNSCWAHGAPNNNQSHATYVLYQLIDSRGAFNRLAKRVEQHLVFTRSNPPNIASLWFANKSDAETHVERKHRKYAPNTKCV